MTGKHRWICPLCGGAVLAGKAPRTNATVRFCLSCSAKSDLLVERTCPVLDAKREAKADRHRAKVERQRAAGKAERERREQEAEQSLRARMAASLDEPKYGDTAKEMEWSMRELDKHLPAQIYHGSWCFGLNLNNTPYRGLSGVSSQHSRASLSILLDYAESIAHPDAAKMRADFLKAGGMPDSGITPATTAS
jgi:hypothetical protein